MTTATQQTQIPAANLEQLLAWLREHGSELTEQEWTHLPAWGAEPAWVRQHSLGAWSWDERGRVLIGTAGGRGENLDLNIYDPTLPDIDGEVVPVDSINSAGIESEARKLGISRVVRVARGEHQGQRVTLYALRNPSEGLDYRVLDTNGDPVWEEADRAVFAETLAAAGIEA